MILPGLSTGLGRTGRRSGEAGSRGAEGRMPRGGQRQGGTEWFALHPSDGEEHWLFLVRKWHNQFGFEQIPLGAGRKQAWRQENDPKAIATTQWKVCAPELGHGSDEFERKARQTQETERTAPGCGCVRENRIQGGSSENNCHRKKMQTHCGFKA